MSEIIKIIRAVKLLHTALHECDYWQNVHTSRIYSITYSHKVPVVFRFTGENGHTDKQTHGRHQNNIWAQASPLYGHLCSNTHHKMCICYPALEWASCLILINLLAFCHTPWIPVCNLFNSLMSWVRSFNESYLSDTDNVAPLENITLINLINLLCVLLFCNTGAYRYHLMLNSRHHAALFVHYRQCASPGMLFG